MGTTLCLMGFLLAPAQAAERTEWPIVPRLSQGQELVYRGSYTEAQTVSDEQVKRNHRIEIRVFVLDASARQTDVALFTVLRPKGIPKGRVEESVVELASLELAHIDGQGKVTIDGDAMVASPLDGPTSRDCGFFVEAPGGRAEVDKSWEIAEPGWPVRVWKLVGLVNVGSSRCLKLVGVQQSGTWGKPRADQAAWRRSDTVWLIPRLDVAQKVERVIEHREPGRQVATHKSTMVYELESSLQYPGELSKDRRREIMMARQFADVLTPLQAKGPRYTKQLEALQAKIDHHLENQPPTPYREAILQIKHRVEAARRGESPPAPITLVKDRPPAVAEMGSAAPDFAASDFNGRQSVRLKSLLGKPAMFVFYNPNSRTAEEQLLFAQKTQEAHKGVLTVVGFPMSDDAEAVGKQKTDLRLTILLLQGSGLRQTYAVNETPKVIILDAKGIVRGSYVGWGSETGPAVLADLKRMLTAP